MVYPTTIPLHRKNPMKAQALPSMNGASEISTLPVLFRLQLVVMESHFLAWKTY
jgi:hypothetical protein